MKLHFFFALTIFILLHFALFPLGWILLVGYVIYQNKKIRMWIRDRLDDLTIKRLSKNGPIIDRGKLPHAHPALRIAYQQELVSDEEFDHFCDFAKWQEVEERFGHLRKLAD